MKLNSGILLRPDQSMSDIGIGAEVQILASDDWWMYELISREIDQSIEASLNQFQPVD